MVNKKRLRRALAPVLPLSRKDEKVLERKFKKKSVVWLKKRRFRLGEAAVVFGGSIGGLIAGTPVFPPVLTATTPLITRLENITGEFNILNHELERRKRMKSKLGKMV